MFFIIGKGVANLLISLPRLTLLICEPYLLREGIKFVHSINVNSFTYKLTYLHTRFPDRDFLMSATSLCPDIKELVIEDQGRDCAEALTRMKVCTLLWNQSMILTFAQTFRKWMSESQLGLYGYPKNTGHLEWNPPGDFSGFKTNGDSKEAL